MKITYIRSLFINFLSIFFINNVMPNIQVKMFENVPNIGADIIFAIILGVLLSLIFPIFLLFEIQPTKAKIAFFSFLIATVGYVFIAVFHMGIIIKTFFAGVGAVIFVGAISFFTNYLEYKNSYKD